MKGIAILSLLCIVSLVLATDCPFGKVNDTYPGDCGRYVDKNNDNICDRSQDLNSLNINTTPNCSAAVNAQPTQQDQTTALLTKVYFVGHTLTTIIATVCILVLAAQLKMKKMQYHRQIAYVMCICAALSLITSFLWGINFTLDIYGIHNVIGFVSMFLSLIPMVVRHDQKLHCQASYAAAFFAILAILTGFIAYWGVFPYMLR